MRVHRCEPRGARRPLAYQALAGVRVDDRAPLVGDRGRRYPQRRPGDDAESMPDGFTGFTRPESSPASPRNRVEDASLAVPGSRNKVIGVYLPRTVLNESEMALVRMALFVAMR